MTIRNNFANSGEEVGGIRFLLLQKEDLPLKKKKKKGCFRAHKANLKDIL